MIALIVAWIFGATAFVDGCSIVLVYRGESIDETAGFIQSDEHREAAAQAAENFLQTMNTARHRYFPLSVAGMLLGAVMVGFAARAMSGREGARGPLIQIVGVQAALVIVTHFLTTDVRGSRAVWDNTVLSARLRESQQDAQAIERALTLVPKIPVVRETVWLVARTLLSGFIVIALTRSRSREFFQAANGRFLER